jgi:hypothetical protein
MSRSGLPPCRQPIQPPNAPKTVAMCSGNAASRERGADGIKAGCAARSYLRNNRSERASPLIGSHDVTLPASARLNASEVPPEDRERLEGLVRDRNGRFLQPVARARHVINDREEERD